MPVNAAVSGFAEVAGTRLYYETAGSGPPLVLVHGFTLDSRMWDDQFEAFSRRYRVVRYDLRGFGRSDLPAGEGYTHPDDLEALLDRLGMARAHVLGLSMGGWIATHFALTRPERVGGLVLADAALIGFRWSPAWKERWRAIEAKAAQAGRAAANRLWLDHPLFAPARETPEVASRLSRIISEYSGWHWANRDPHRAIDPPDIQRLDRVRSPTLIVIGERDLPDFQATAAALQQGIPGAATLLLPGVGHMSSMEAPRRFNEAVRGFLDTLETGEP